MSVFRNHKTRADRSASDRSRHKKKIDKAIRESVHDIISEESIIGQDGKKKIKIPVRGIKEYQFVFGDNGGEEGPSRSGSGKGRGLKKGQVLGKKQKKKGKNNKPGDKPGEEFYEVEITLDELASYLFDDLNLPDLEKKSFKNIVSEKFKRSGYRKQGIKPRLSKKKTMVERLKRKKKAVKMGKWDPESEERFPFHDADIRYKHFKKKEEESDCAVIFFLMDVSGSMSRRKKYLVRSFFFLLYQFLRYKYTSVEIVFISHTTVAQEVDEQSFFTRGSSGGTKISSALELTKEVINKRFHPSSWNIYVFHGSDGDNWGDDNERCFNILREIENYVQMYALLQVDSNESVPWSDIQFGSKLQKIASNKIKSLSIVKKTDVWECFTKLFGTGVFNE